MNFRNALALLLLAAIWGSSFLFMRIASPALGGVALAALRLAGAALILLPWLLWRGQPRGLKRLIPTLLVSGLISYALPFVLFSQASRTLPAGLLSIFNASTPLWGALVGWLWMGERLSASRLLGLCIGFTGVFLLALDRLHFGSSLAWQAILMCLTATLMYALGVHHARRYLRELSPMRLTSASLSAAALWLLLPAAWIGPQTSSGAALPWSGISAGIWWAVVGVALLCTALGYVLFYRLSERIGPSSALTVTFLVPVFGMLWGSLFLQEIVSPAMLASTAVIILGTVLSSGAWSPLNRGKELTP